MADRLATSGDVSTYAAFGVQVNDLILETNEVSASRQSFHDMWVDWPGFRSGGTIWLKNPSEGSRYGLNITGNGTNWGGGSSGSPNKIKILDLNLMSKDMEKNINTYNFQVFDCQYIELDGYHPSYKGMNDPNFGANPLSYFGWRLDKNGQAGNGTNQFAVKGDVKEVTVKNVYITDGFAKFRLQPDNTSVLDKVAFLNCWGEFGNGESYYLDTTNAVGGAAPVAKNWHMADCVSYMTGAEGFQLQDLMWGTRNNLVENCLLLYAARDWKSPFLAAQGSGLQLRYNEGGIIVRNMIIYGWGNNGLNLQLNTKGNPSVNNGQIVFENVLFIDGHNRCVLLNTTDQNCPIVMNRCDFGHIRETYASQGGTQASEQIDIFNLIDFTVKNSRYSNNRTFYIETDPGDGANSKDVNNTAVADSAIERPSFVDNVLPNAVNLLNWNWQTSAGSDTPGLSIDFLIGDVVRFKIMEEVFTVDTSTDEIIKTGHDYNNGDFFLVDTEGTLPSPMQASTIYYVVNKSANRFQISLTSGGSAIDITTSGSGKNFMWKLVNAAYGNFYQSKTNHSGSESTRPDKDTTNWQLYTTPNKDVRLTAGSQHEIGGRRRGFSFGPTNYTGYQWQVSTDGGSTWADIPYPTARNMHFNYAEIGYSITGKKFRRTIVGKASGLTGTNSSPASATF